MDVLQDLVEFKGVLDDILQPHQLFPHPQLLLRPELQEFVPISLADVLQLLPFVG